MLKYITRGGQVHLHQLRMIRQIVVFAFVLSFLGSGSVFVYRTSKHVPSEALSQAWEYGVAELNLMLSPWDKSKVTQQYVSIGGHSYTRKSIDIVRDPLIHKIIFLMKKTFYKEGAFALKVFMGLMINIFFLWWVWGRIQEKNTHLRGGVLSTMKKVRKKLFWKGEGSSLKLGGFLFLKMGRPLIF